MFNDPEWPRASANFADDGTIGVFRVPLNASITPGRCDLAPEAILGALARYSTHDFDNPSEIAKFCEEGSIPAGDPETLREKMPDILSISLAQRRAVILIGGDNGITYPGALSLGDLSRVGVITLDAHLDVRNPSLGLINGNPIRHLIESGLPGSNIVQIGIQAFANSPSYAAYADQQRIQRITANEVHRVGIDWAIDHAFDLLAHVDSLYFDLDLDVLDRSFAPGCPGSRPGGLFPNQIRTAAHRMGMEPRVKIMDLVELDPTQDRADITAMAAAACILEFASGVSLRA